MIILYDSTLCHMPEGTMSTQGLIDECVEQHYSEQTNRQKVVSRQISTKGYVAGPVLACPQL